VRGAKHERPTLKDIAREVGVHVSTISRALNRDSAHAVSPDLARKIRRASKRRGYQPNAAAVMLKTNRSRTIGVVIPDITDPVFPPIIRGIEDGLARHGYVAILANTDGDPERQARVIETLCARGADGLILANVARQDASASRLAAGMAVVTVNRRSRADHYRAGVEAAELIVHVAANRAVRSRQAVLPVELIVRDSVRTVGHRKGKAEAAAAQKAMERVS
jgi:DNA-binding LacI/PurR family transcriptional regulator